MPQRFRPSRTDKHAFYHAWSGQCSYCRRNLEFGDFEIDHIIPQHLLNDPENLRLLLTVLGLDDGFDINSDFNLRPTCRSCNNSKSGNCLPTAHIIFLLNEAKKKAPDVAEFRKQEISTRRLNKALIDIDKLMESVPSARDRIQLLFPLESTNFPNHTLSHWPDDQASKRVRAIFGAASSNLLTWPDQIEGQWIERPELVQIEAAIESQGKKAIALLGPPGSGKSALLARLGSKLSADGRVLLGIKADMLPRHIASMPDLDADWGLQEPLPIVLERLAAESSVVLLIDQLDALAPLMDSHSERLSAMSSLIRRALEIPRVVVIISCRSFDAEHDMRLRKLIHPTKRIELPDLQWDKVQSLLEKRGYQPGSWPQAIKDLLSRPQHIKIFLESFALTKGQPAFTSLHGMLEDVLAERIFRPYGFSTSKVLDSIVAAMSEMEDLWIPIAPLQQEFSTELTHLLHADLITRDHTGLRIGLTHQTLFEFLRGRSFAGGETSLFDEVLARQDGLAIRPLLWNAIGYLKTASPTLYRKKLLNFFESSSIRLHIKLLLVDFLGTVTDPSIEEARCLKIVLSNPSIRPHVMRAIEKKPQWFALLREAIARCNEDGPDAAWQASWVLGPALEFDREFVLSKLESKWLKQPAIDVSTFNVFRDCKNWDAQTARIIEKVVSRTTIAPMFVCDYAQSMAKTRPDLAIKMIRSKLDFDLTRSQASIQPHIPASKDDATFEDLMSYDALESERFQPLKKLLEPHGEWYELKKIVHLFPAEFVEAVWTWVEKLALLLSKPVSFGTRRYLTDYGWNFNQKYSANYLTEAVWDAVSAFAKLDSIRFLKWVEVASGSVAHTIHQLIAHGLTHVASEYPVSIINYLLSDYRRLRIGNYEGKNGTLRLLAAVQGYINEEQVNRLANWIDAWEPYDFSKLPEDRHEHYTQLARDDRLQLLTLLPVDKLHNNCQLVTDNPFDDSEDIEVEATWIQSPLTLEQMELMQNDELLVAINEWPDERERSTSFRFGGSHEVANQLREFTKKHPQRALWLIDRLQSHTQERAAAAIADGLIQAEEQDATALCELLHQLLGKFSSESFRRHTAWALVDLSQRESGLNEQSIQDLLHLITYPDHENVQPESTEAEELGETPKNKESALWGRYGSAFPDGNFPVLLALTLGLLRQDPPAKDRWFDILVAHLEIDELAKVWKALLGQLKYLVWCDKEKSAEFVQKLFEKYVSLFTTVEGVRFIAANHLWLPQSFVHHAINKIEQSDWQLGLRSAGELWMLRSGLASDDALAQQQLTSTLEALNQGNSSDFLLGFVTSAAETWMNSELRETSTLILAAIASTAKEDFAEAFTSAFILHEDQQIPGDDCTERLLNVLSSNPALLITSHTAIIVARLKELMEKGYTVTVVGKACRRIVETAGQAIGDIRTSFFGTSPELIDIAITLQRFPEARSDGTWIFEQLLALNAYKVDSAKIALDQRIF